MTTSKKTHVLFALASAAALTAAAGSAQADDTVNVIVLKEHAVGGSRQAQPYIDQLMSVAAEKVGWASVKGKWITSRGRAKKYIRSKKPSYGILSLGAFLSLRKSQGLEVLGTVDANASGGRRYFLVSKDGRSLAACRGKKVATNHAADAVFVDKVVSGGAFKLGDFDIVKTRRPVQTLKKVIRDEAACALIDDAQKAELAHISGGSEVGVAWSSAELPPMAVVAFSGAPAEDRAKFKASLGAICSGSGKSHCDKVGIKSLSPADGGVYAAVVRAYGQ
ncbi:MAG: hypothetical protein AAGA56_13790 [Myxococcota bacterium]